MATWTCTDDGARRAMMPAAKHGDPQLGVDVHLCVVPPSPSPVPLPTPHMSIVFDPMDYLPFIGATVTVCGMKRAVAGTAGQAVHIPPGFPFAPKLPDKDDELFMGSATVEADGDPFSFLGVPVLACQAVGMPSPPRPRRKGGPRIMMLPTVFNLAIPTNVFVGGPPTISLMGMAFKAGLAGLGKLARSNFARAIGARFQAWRKAKFGHLKPGFLKCKVLRAEPVNIVTGAVSVTQVDFTLPGLIPIRWTRRYASDNPRRGACGVGWESPADVRLEHDAESGTVLFRDPEGEIAIFPAMPAAQGEAGAVLELMDGARLTDHGGEFRVGTKEDRVYRFPKSLAVAAAGGTEYPLGEVRDLCGNALVYERQGGVLVAIRESAGRRVAIETGPEGLIRRLGLEVPDIGFRHGFVTYEHDAAGDLVAVYDALGHPYRFAYDRHHMLRHTDRNGLSFHYEYDRTGESWRVLRAWGDGGLYAYRFAYLDAVNERRITDSLGHVSVVTLDERGLPISEVDPLGGRTVFEYDDAGRTSAVVDQDGHRTEYVFDERGNLLSLTRPDGTRITAAYGPQDKPVQVADPAGATWEQEVDARGLPLVRRGPSGAETVYQHDQRGLPGTIVDPLGQTTHYTYDAFGNPIEVVDTLGHTIRFAYDTLGNLVRRQEADGRVTQFAYDAKGRLTRAVRADGGEMTFTYDGADNVTRHADPDGRVTRFTYRGQGSLVGRVLPDGRTIDYAYDNEERLIAVRNQRGEVHRLRRDPLGRVVEEIDYWGQSRRYSYTGAGHLRAVTDPIGRVIHTTTDAMGRVVRKLVPDQQSPDRYERTIYGYNANGALTLCENVSTRVERCFDPEGRLVEERQGAEFVVRNRYDLAGNLVQRTTVLTAADGTARTREVGFIYDRRNQVTGVDLDGRPGLRRERNAAGQVVADHFGGVLSRRFAYTGDGRLAEQCVIGSHGAAPLDQRYSYDAAGNLVERHDSGFGIDGFAYDACGVLVEHLLPGGSRVSFRRDAAGDRIIAHGADAWGPDPADPDQPVRTARLGASCYRFDRTGNLVERSDADGTLRLTWNADQRLIQSRTGNRTTDYRYDGLGRRIAKRTDGIETRFFWSGDLLIGEAVSRAAAGNRTVRLREWVHSPGGYTPLAVADSHRLPGTNDWQDTLHLVHTDPNGCPTRLFDQQGRCAWSARLGAWGAAEVEEASRVDNPLRLQGQYHDAETGLHYNRFRYYDPRAGQFISQDPLGLAAGENPYHYAPNIWRWIDPLGLNNCDDLDEAVLYRIKRGDKKGRPFGSPRNPRPPTVEEFNPRIREIPAGELDGAIIDRKHGIFPEQAESVKTMSNEDLIAFRPHDPISAHETAAGLELTGGHHRTNEIARRVSAGELPPNTPVPVLLHD